MGEYERAGECYDKARKIAEAIAPEGDLINEIYRRIGDLKVRTGDLEGAWSATERSLEVSLSLGDRFEESLTYRVRGLILKERGERAEAIVQLRCCLETLSSLGEKYETARTRLEIGVLLGEFSDREDELDQAEYHLQVAIDLFEDLGVDYYRERAAIEMARVHITRGEDEKVLDRLSLVKNLSKGAEDEEELTIKIKEIKVALEDSIVDRVLSSKNDDYSLGGINASAAGISYNEEGLEKLLSIVLNRVKADRGFIARRRGPGRDYKVSISKGLGILNSEKILRHLKSAEKRIFSEKRPLLSVDTPGDDRFFSIESEVMFGVSSLAIAPFGVEDNVEGICYVDRETCLSDSPFLFEELMLLANFSSYLAFFVAAMERDELRKDNKYLKGQLHRRAGFDNIITQDPKMYQVMDEVNKLKDSKIHVLLLGETGTGKELIAEAVHYTGVRRNRRFIAVNCAALPDNLLESELFGHRRGSFTGAVTDKKGLFEVTDRGTFFLDEVADMGLSTQVKLLRFLESGELKRLGDTVMRKVDVRILSATNKNLDEEIKAGRFRQDLFYRLDGIRIDIPPLRDRRADIPILISHFIEKYSAEEEKDVVGVTPEALNLLVSHDWPGNVRELLNEIRRAVTLAEEGEIIGPHLLSERIKTHVLGEADDSDVVDAGSTLPELMASFERQRIFMALKDARWIKTRAAKQLGIHEATLRGKMRRYGLEGPTGE
jgi:transcriptional regulator with GAF, ATPase, and Fis domain